MTESATPRAAVALSLSAEAPCTDLIADLMAVITVLLRNLRARFFFKLFLADLSFGKIPRSLSCSVISSADWLSLTQVQGNCN